MPALEGGDMDKYHVPWPQGYCFVMSVIIPFVALGLFLLVNIGLFIGTLDTVPQLLDILTKSGH